jgi:ribosomal protein L14
MVFVQTRLKVVDNSGGYEAMCIGILGKSYRFGKIGDIIVVSIKKIILNRKVKHQKKKKIIKGSVYKGILIRSSNPQKR